MSILVVAEHDNSELKGATLNTLAAAEQIGGDVVVLVAGENCSSVAEQAGKAAGVSKVHIVDAGMPHSVLLEIYSDTGVGTEIVG